MPNFDDLSEIYDALIDWPKRLAHEEPFYHKLFASISAKSVVDVACGTGRHAAMFHAWGLKVVGADVSPAMIERARARLGEPPGLSWRVGSFQDAQTSAGTFDAAVCVGNSLALVADMAAVERSIRAILSRVCSGGLVILHVLNVGSLPDGPMVWQKCRRETLPMGEVIILKGVHRLSDRGLVELALIDPGGNLLKSQTFSFLDIEGAQLADMATRAGAVNVQLFGGYKNQPYQRESSPDLIAVLRRA